MIDDDEAAALAESLLAEQLPQRWRHVRGVAHRAEVFRPVHDAERVELLIVAGLLHDIGYADAVRDTGFHPLDGALHLRSLGIDERVVNLVANHSCAWLEARLHGIDSRLAIEFPRDRTLPHDELLFCDLTVGPGGEPFSFEQRLDDIRNRYARGHVVRRFIDEAEPEIRAALNRAERLLQPVLVPA